MAVKKSKKEEVVEVVEVVEEGTVVDIPQVSTTEETKPIVEVDEESAKIEDEKQPEKMVKIKMRLDHKCTIGGERLFLVKGKTYLVTENVKTILNDAGLLSPL